MNACEITAAVTALANTISAKFDNDELSLIGAIVTQLGDTLETIAAKRELCESLNNKKSCD